MAGRVRMKWLKAIFGAPNTIADAPADTAKSALPLDLDAILPLLKPHGWQEAMRQQLAATPHNTPDESDVPIAHRTHLDAVVISYVDDRGDTMRYISTRQAEAAGLDAQTLHAHALRNLARLYLPRLEIAGTDGRYVVHLDGMYDATMLLVWDQWHDQLQLNGDPVVAIPAANTVMICGDNDAESVERMAIMAVSTARTSPHAITPELLIWHAGLLDPID